jgi:deoxyribonucleoside regulator
MPNDLSFERHQLLADIATWYYVDGLSQQEIAKRVNLSRPSISRLLDEARELSIVEIEINQPIPTVLELEREVAKNFSLKEVRVLERKTTTDEEALRLLGRLGVIVLNNYLQDGMTFGLSWGTTVHTVIEALRPRRLPNVKVVQLVGGVGAPYRTIDAPENCRYAGRMFGAQHYYLNAPLRVEKPEIARALREDHSIKDELELAKQTDIALLGIGSILPEISTLYHSGYILHDELRKLQGIGVVGSVCVSHFDINGHCVEAPWIDRCSIGVTWDDMQQFGTTIGVALGKRKAPAILGAIRTGIIDILITDDITVEEILSLAK